MENQHRKISGYRELGEVELNLVNQIKQKGAELLQLQASLAGLLSTQLETKIHEAKKSTTHQPWEQGASDECIELRRFQAAEPLRWAAIGKTDIQTGIMALVRAVAQSVGGI
ncbi:Acb2/Tad1 domain-containing protein [Cupriavidus basilensis]|uniref:Acb2/Tad1 domain-containing protein n=1 Tax=Cupriavidus basilensis TaxID=68895 RepID=UPI0020A6561A|nr:hypothetical protein [Cupriavidus basilensis]MCP3017472.1 hypothetical protein [Cupriavidus basilensis]